MSWSFDVEGNLSGARGDTGSFLVPPVGTDGEPYDPTGHSARWQAYSGSEILLDKTTGGGISIVSDPEGDGQAWLVTITAAETAGLPEATLSHEFKAQDPSGRVVQLIHAVYRPTASSIKDQIQVT